MIQDIPSIAWPPAYKIKRHRKARYVKLRPSKEHGLEITVPYRFNIKEIPGILAENQAWITKQLLQIEAQKVETLPTKIELHAVCETWQIYYQPCNAKLEMIIRPQREIVLVGNVQDKNLCKQKLIAWLKQVAKEFLISQLTLLSNETQLDFNSITIRDQQTRWGSCTAKKSLSLNYKLIFLPANLMMHVIIHELCHTKYLNHSEQFWNLVAKYDLHWQEHRRALRRADQFVPGWI